MAVFIIWLTELHRQYHKLLINVMIHCLKSAIYHGRELTLIDILNYLVLDIILLTICVPFFYNEQVSVGNGITCYGNGIACYGNGITCYGNGITSLTVFGIKHQIIIDTHISFCKVTEHHNLMF